MELTLSNLRGGVGTEAFSRKWSLINGNQIWAKKLVSLLQELEHRHPHIVESFKCIRMLQDDVFGDFLAELD